MLGLFTDLLEGLLYVLGLFTDLLEGLLYMLGLFTDLLTACSVVRIKDIAISALARLLSKAANVSFVPADTFHI
jgi:hypothetical protein